MKRIICSACMITIAITLISCDKKSDTVTGTGAPTLTIVPLVVGNQWNYIDSTFNADGSTRADSSILAITGSTSIQYAGKSVPVFYWNWCDGKTAIPQDLKWLCAIEDSGLFFYGGKSSKGTYVLARAVSVKYPVAVNESWTRINITASVDSVFHLGDTSVATCTATGENIALPAGTMRCYVIASQRIRVIGATTSVTDTYLYYVPNIGYVGLVNIENGRITSKKLLRRYTVKLP